jgi:hypothetical protein
VGPALMHTEPVLTPAGGEPAYPDEGGRQYLTELAIQAIDLSDTFAALFATPFPEWGAELAAPPGMSTAGGRLSKQHIGLRSPGGGTLVIGTVDRSARRAEMRSYRRVDEVHRERFGFRFPISPSAYVDLTGRIRRFLQDEGFEVKQEGDGGGGSSARSSWVLWLVAVLLLLLAVGGAAVGLWVWRSRQVAVTVPGAAYGWPAGVPVQSSPALPPGWPAMPVPAPPPAPAP